MLIYVDTLEKNGSWDFVDMPKPETSFSVHHKRLKTGDYMVDRFTAATLGRKHGSQLAIERKTLPDLYGTLGNSTRRTRFIRELQRSTEYGYFAIIVEAEWHAILKPNKYLVHPTRLNPKSAMASLLAWSQRYNVHLFTLPGRDVAQIFAFRMFERWVRDKRLIAGTTHATGSVGDSPELSSSVRS